MKRIFSLIICIATVLSFSAYAANDSITVLIDGVELVTPVDPQLVNNRTMLPARAIFESLGAKVTWMGEEKMVFATRGNMFITLKIGVPAMSVQTTDSSENKSVPLDAVPYIYNNSTLVPARAVAEAMHAEVDWIAETRTVVITTEQRKE